MNKQEHDILIYLKTHQFANQRDLSEMTGNNLRGEIRGKLPQGFSPHTVKYAIQELSGILFHSTEKQIVIPVPLIQETAVEK